MRQPGRPVVGHGYSLPVPQPDARDLTRPGTLDPRQRARDLDRLAEHGVDVLVVGGGVTGAGIALDAAARGLTVALCERADLAAGTSRWPSTLGAGLRRPARGQVGAARQRARERAVLMRVTAPHLVRRLPFLVPDVAGRDVSALAELGGRLGDAVRVSVRGGRGSLPGTGRVGAEGVGRLLPAVRPGRGGVVSWAGQLEDDARLVVALARTAAAFGARVLTGVTVTGVDGGTVELSADGTTVAVRAEAVVNAAGVAVQRLAPGVDLVPLRRTHLVVPAARLGRPIAALAVPLPGSRSRYVVALPQPGGLVHLGVTDEPVGGPVPDEVPAPGDAEVGRLLAAVNAVLSVPLQPSDVVGAFAGLHPGPADPSGRPVPSWDGSVLTVAGGELTTHRATAAEAVDAVVDRLGRGARRSPTARLPLVGAAPERVLARVDAPARLVHRYGTEAPVVAALGDELVVEGREETVGELRFAVRFEGARTVADLLDRRTRIGLVTPDRERAVAVAGAVLTEV